MIRLARSSARPTASSGSADPRRAGPIPAPQTHRRTPFPAPEADRLAQQRRRQDLEAFATLLDEVYHLPCSLVWHSHDSRQHRLHFWTPSDGWQCEVGTIADLAHRLHVLGVAQRAAQRQQLRDSRSQVHL
jgi:hypothetical protein